MDEEAGRMRSWIYKTDEAGKPRRFLNHGEAILWALLTVGKLLGALALIMLLNSLFDPDRGEIRLSILTPILVVILLATWSSISLILYLYVMLSGGIMDDRARQRYRNNETLSRPR